MAVLGTLAALVVAGVLYQRISTWRFRRRFAPPGLLIDVGGHRLHALCRGHGAPVVLLESGIAASSLSWAVVQPEIATFTRACAYDRAGLAWSERGSGPRTFRQIVSELSGVLERVAADESCVLVGHSFGGFVVRAYAARYPARVRGLVMIDPPTEWLTPSARHVRMLRGGRQLSQVGALLAQVGVVRGCLALLTGGAPGAPRQFVKVFGPTAARTLERLVGEVRKLPPDLYPTMQELWCNPKCFRAMAEHLHVLEREGPAFLAQNPPPEVPVIVVSSAHQTSEQIADHQALAALSAAGRHVVAARSAHWVQFDEPELVVALVRELVSSSHRG